MKRSLLVTLVALAVAVPAALASGGDGTRIALKPVKAFPAAKGSAKFWVKDGALSKLQYHVEGKRTINNEEQDINRTTTVEFKDVGSTKVEVPAEAKAKMK